MQAPRINTILVRVAVNCPDQSTRYDALHRAMRWARAAGKLHGPDSDWAQLATMLRGALLSLGTFGCAE